MAALVTDGLRAQYLEQEGYDVQVLEFIDMEHTPKNILIRAVRNQINTTTAVIKITISILILITLFFICLPLFMFP